MRVHAQSVQTSKDSHDDSVSCSISRLETPKLREFGSPACGGTRADFCWGHSLRAPPPCKAQWTGLGLCPFLRVLPSVGSLLSLLGRPQLWLFSQDAMLSFCLAWPAISGWPLLPLLQLQVWVV